MDLYGIIIWKDIVLDSDKMKRNLCEMSCGEEE